MSDAEPPRPYFCGRIRPRPRHFRERPRPIRAAGSFSSATAPFSELRYDKRGMGETVYLTYRGLRADRRIGRVFLITVRETYLSTGRRAASRRLAPSREIREIFGTAVTKKGDPLQSAPLN